MNNKSSPQRVLTIGAMDTELQPLFSVIGKSKVNKLLNIFPFYKIPYRSLELYVIQSYVGDVNASIASYEAIRTVKPDCVIKFGAVGGSYFKSRTRDIIVPLGYFHRTSWITRNKKSSKPTNDASVW